MSYLPEWEGPIEGWTVNFLAKHHWKVARTMPREDAMQEAVVVFLRLRRKYCMRDVDPVTDPPHFMALYKTSWQRHFIDLANADTEDRVCTSMPEDHEGVEREQTGCTDNDGVLAVMVRQAPREVSMVLALFLNAPQELLDLALNSWRNAGRGRPAESTRINQLLGLPSGYDSLGAVSEYFGV